MNSTLKALTDLSNCLDDLTVSLKAARNQFSLAGMYGKTLNRVNSISDNELELTFEMDGKKTVIRFSAITNEDGRAVLEIEQSSQT